MDEWVRRVMGEVVDEMTTGQSEVRRDPERIEAIFGKLREVWMRNTDMRFGQLVYNLFWQMPETKKTGEVGIDVFYVEDDAFERRLDEVIREG